MSEGNIKLTEGTKVVTDVKTFAAILVLTVAAVAGYLDMKTSLKGYHMECMHLLETKWSIEEEQWAYDEMMASTNKLRPAPSRVIQAVRAGLGKGSSGN